MIALEYQLQRFHDFHLLQHFMIILKESGGCIFYYPFKKTEISSDLISGFISAMSSMYGEFTGDGKQESVESLKYQGMNLDGFSGRYVMGILISEGHQATRYDLNDFIRIFESEYEDVLMNWRGFVKIFDYNWIAHQLFNSIGYRDNLPFVISSHKPEKKQYQKVVDFLRIVGDRQGRFLIRKVLPGLQKFLNVSEAYVLDLLLMMKKDDVISHAPIAEILSSNESKAISETISSGIIIEDSSVVASDILDEMDDHKHSQDTEGELSSEQRRTLTVTDQGEYIFRIEISLDVIMRHSGDSWLRDIISDAVELELGKRVVVDNPQYIPQECDSDKGTIWIDVHFSDAAQD
ncbi:MAG: hypothetical protein ACFFED_08695 [Candidatus Thorarchaeota archaeon]